MAVQVMGDAARLQLDDICQEAFMALALEHEALTQVSLDTYLCRFGCLRPR
jgi:hypothetical protein